MTVQGRVQSPGRFPWRPGMTLRDVIALSRGPSVGADLRAAEVSRLPRRAARRESSPRSCASPSTRATWIWADRMWRSRAPGASRSRPGEPHRTSCWSRSTRCTVSLQPDFQLQREVIVTGEVSVPGRYTLRTKDDRLTRSREPGRGPARHGATRKGHDCTATKGGSGRVDVDLPSALANGVTDQNITLEPGDSLYVPVYSPTVVVPGAVNSPATVLYREGADLAYYIETAAAAFATTPTRVAPRSGTRTAARSFGTSSCSGRATPSRVRAAWWWSRRRTRPTGPTGAA